MILHLLSEINYIAVLVTAVIFFIEGSLWFSVIFKNVWRNELKHNHVTLKEPTTNELTTKMVLTFVSNLLASLGMACLVRMTHSTTSMSGLHLGILVALAFVVTSVGTVFVWENKSLKLFLIDVGYPTLGILTSAIILSIWL